MRDGQTQDEEVEEVVLESRRRDPLYVPVSCPFCKADLEFIPPKSSPTADRGPRSFVCYIKCASCNRAFEHRKTGRKAGPSGTPEKVKRRYGTDQNPLETEYYDLLSVSPLASQDEIKKCYRRLALTLHPDKTAGDIGAEERFKSIGVAYQVLSDPKLRRKYNEYGAKKDISPEGGFSDPEELFAQLFGGERFESIIGTISIGRDMADALKQGQDESQHQARDSTSEGAALSSSEKLEKEKLERELQEEKDRTRADRIIKLTEALEKRLDDYVRIHGNSEQVELFRKKHRHEAEELKTESYGAEILNAVGFTYNAKSEAYLSRTSLYFGGIRGMWHGVKGSAHVLSETVGTLRSAMDLKNHFERIEKEEKEGKLTEERKKILEEEAAEKGMRALWLGAKLEVESVTRDVCDAVLCSTTEVMSADTQDLPAFEVMRRRAIGLSVLGDIYCNVRKDHNDITAEAYVKVDAQT